MKPIKPRKAKTTNIAKKPKIPKKAAAYGHRAVRWVVLWDKSLSTQ